VSVFQTAATSLYGTRCPQFSWEMSPPLHSVLRNASPAPCTLFNLWRGEHQLSNGCNSLSSRRPSTSETGLKNMRRYRWVTSGDIRADCSPLSGTLFPSQRPRSDSKVLVTSSSSLKITNQSINGQTLKQLMKLWNSTLLKPTVSNLNYRLHWCY